MINLEVIRDYRDLWELVIAPILVVIVPGLAIIYYKVASRLKDIKKTFIFRSNGDITNWETNFSRTLVQSVSFYLDGVKASPYCHADQILYLGLENGVVGPSNLHSMYLSVRAETSGFSRLPARAIGFQRVPYAATNEICSDADEQRLLYIPDREKSKYKGLSIFANTGSALVIPLYTKEHWLAGLAIFGYLDVDYNHQEQIEDDEEFIQGVKAYIEGQMLQMELARISFLKEKGYM